MLTLKELKNLEGKLNFCTARATEAWLQKKAKKERAVLYVELDGNTEFITNGRERREHFRSIDSAWLEKQLKKDSKDIRIADLDHPLEVISGDVCLILKIEGEKYILSQYRDIEPIGWLIPGGLPKNLEELCYPIDVATREVREEVLIADTSGRVYTLGEQTEQLTRNIKLWDLSPSEIVPLSKKNIFLERTGLAQPLNYVQPSRSPIKGSFFNLPATICLGISLE